MLLNILIQVWIISLSLAYCPDEGVTARASDSSTWPAGSLLKQQIMNPTWYDEELVLDFPLLLDTESPVLFGLLINGSGRLVFDQEADLAKLTAHYVIVRDGGELWIGSEDCPFQGQAEILLVGTQDLYDGIKAKHSGTTYGEKFLGVEDNGIFEIHGSPKVSWTKLDGSLAAGPLNKIQLLEDVSSWLPGDRLVILSTDYSMDQAEIVTVDSCQGKTCTLEAGTTLKYMHSGIIDSGIDMRGEVGLLTRNVLIHGNLTDYCDPQVDIKCGKLDNQPDKFGGHIMGKGKFTSFKIENAELTHMGQHGVLARYPIHWHMAKEVTVDMSYVRSNSIHHNLQRCVTCHGTFGCVVENNMAFETFGHCYFMEDGVEKGAQYRGNLGANTRIGKMIPSDKKPATFWMTHPNVTVTGNVAGGSEGVGFWFLYPDQPTGLTAFFISQGLESASDYFVPGELHRTVPVNISGNTIHSSVSGYFYDNKLTNVFIPADAAIGVQGTYKDRLSDYTPRADPANKSSAQVWFDISGITCYKASRVCIWMSVERVRFSNLHVAESPEGMFSHAECTIDNSLFVGASEFNFGAPNVMINGELFPRSLSKGFRRGIGNKRFASIGYLGYRPPITISNTEFRNFYDEAKETGIRRRALSVETASFNNIKAGVFNVTFTNSPLENCMIDINMRSKQRQTIYNDFTGSIGGYANSSIVSNLTHMVSPYCYNVSEWADVGSRAVCPHKFMSMVISKKNDMFLHNKTSVQRDDMPEKPYEKYDGLFNVQKNKIVATENMYYLNTDYSHIISILDDFSENLSSLQQQLEVNVFGVDNGINTRLGVCVPMNASMEVMRWMKRQPVYSLDNLDKDTDNSKFYHDTEAGVVFFRVTGSEATTVQIGDTNKILQKKKITLRVRVFGGGSADCRERGQVYPKYKDLAVKPAATTQYLVKPVA